MSSPSNPRSREEAVAYPVSFEIAGPAAMFARPDTGSTPVSYPAPTFSAAKGMFETVARRPGAYIRPTRVEICRPIRYDRYTTNYGGPLRKPGQFKAGNNYQLIATILADVCFRVHGVVEALPGGHTLNEAHALQEIFTRRLARGQSLSTPCLGWSEFAPTYFGPLRDDSSPLPEIQLEIESMLFSVFDKPADGRVAPTFRRDVRVRGGVLSYDEEVA